MKKLVMVSLDLMAALPIASLAFILLFSSMRNSQAYLLNSADFQGRYLDEMTVSQQIAGLLDLGNLNYTSSLQSAEKMSAENGFVLSISPLDSPDPCAQPSAVCRIVTISGSAYLLVLSYENAS